MATVVGVGRPRHLTQRGNRRRRTFFRKDDYQAYREFMGEGCGQCVVKVRAYCVMPNHVHLMVVPESEDGLRRSESTGRPAGSEPFVQRLERIVGRVLRRQKPGLKKKDGGRKVWSRRNGPRMASPAWLRCRNGLVAPECLRIQSGVAAAALHMERHSGVMATRRRGDNGSNGYPR